MGRSQPCRGVSMFFKIYLLFLHASTLSWKHFSGTDTSVDMPYGVTWPKLVVATPVNGGSGTETPRCGCCASVGAGGSRRGQRGWNPPVPCDDCFCLHSVFISSASRYWLSPLPSVWADSFMLGNYTHFPSFEEKNVTADIFPPAWIISLISYNVSHLWACQCARYQDLYFLIAVTGAECLLSSA